MSRFVKIDNTYVNLDFVTDFYYEEKKNTTYIAFVNQGGYHIPYLGDYTNDLLDGKQYEV